MLFITITITIIIIKLIIIITIIIVLNEEKSLADIWNHTVNVALIITIKR